MAEECLFCVGCGAPIQTSQPQELGYVPAATLAAREDQQLDIYCQRCFRLRHYNEIEPVSLTNADFLKVLSQISQQSALVVNVIDIFDVDGSLLPSLQRFIGNNPYILVGNKEDLLPKSLKRAKIKDWLRQRANQVGLKPLAVVLLSAEKNRGIDELVQQLNKYRQQRDIYFVGVTNVGKSTLINHLLQQAAGIKNLITASRFPGTTLDFIKLPLTDGGNLIDTPGIMQPNQIIHRLTPKEMKLIQPNKELKPKVYQLGAGQTLLLGGLARIDYLKCSKKSLVLYLAERLKVHRTKTENAEYFIDRHLGELLQPPFKENAASFRNLQRHVFKAQQKSDLVFSGLGWVTIPVGATIAAWAPKETGVTIRKAMI
ncbi:ribosome biogenesis GTPase YqeH [Liquorilactobacillus sicerae]|uniref:ribosome biogenesis GTPase YqeH n=1 Tax=Liquorilactobacillus sicerae TaxID=1416943 RepID=UPI00247FC33B|nr:ribosome biogenesis GTPase YqeH [Liquorilactobacillus sicerae]